MTAPNFTFLTVTAATVVTAVWGIGGWYFFKRDQAEGRGPHDESFQHICWVATIPISLLAYFLFLGGDLEPQTGMDLFATVVLGEVLGFGIIVMFHEAVWGHRFNRLERPLGVTMAVGVFLYCIAVTFHP
ncbi:hypothetical protein QWJ46_17830 [Rhizobium sp. CBN3]|uniref:hypothetical protein n=1 Tax=Rhizobium sp. CBN3 TaxID=3058045 RepID=UPI00267324DD|nr:hypothetical protein [Rhizobium sp. CBN3]MDO3434538.1 hypothetical protein [Rhizobium sp. CBN3]